MMHIRNAQVGADLAWCWWQCGLIMQVQSLLGFLYRSNIILGISRLGRCKWSILGALIWVVLIPYHLEIFLIIEMWSCWSLQSKLVLVLRNCFIFAFIALSRKCSIRRKLTSKTNFLPSVTFLGAFVTVSFFISKGSPSVNPSRIKRYLILTYVPSLSFSDSTH